MDSLVVSQVISVSAPQMEVDKAAKAQSITQNAQEAQEGAFVALIRHSMDKVHEMLGTEKEDPLLKEDDEEKQNPED
ncbi:MAG: hypothetical protein S4CHLAM6_13020 [Chlamydiae bacterium]|nr:hypothetical protein [Chlamydiota bacterium]